MKNTYAHLLCVLVGLFMGNAAQSEQASRDTLTQIDTVSSTQKSVAHTEQQSTETTAVTNALPKANVLLEAQPFIVPADYGTALDTPEAAAKKKQLIALVRKGVDAIQKYDLAKACDAINRSPEFKQGELYLYVYDLKGILLANGLEVTELWKNQYDDRDEFGIYPVRGLVERALSGGGWHIYRWHHGTKVAYVALTEKDGQKYVVGGGYYPLSKSEYVVGLVKVAVSTYKGLIAKGESSETVWGMFSYPLGKFVYGDVSLKVFGPEGQVYADAERPGMVGESAWNQQDSTGAYVVRTIVERLNKELPEHGIWFESKINNTIQKIYAERIQDDQKKNLYITSAYYPEAGCDAAVNLVKKGAVFLRTYGTQETQKKITYEAQSEFADTLREYAFGYMTLFVYDMHGVCVAHGENSEVIGKNQSKLRDDNGRFIVQELIEKAKREGKGWLDFRMKNAFWNVYSERVDIGKKSFIVGCGVYPLTKQEMMTLLTKSAAEYLYSHDDKKSFYDVSDEDGIFVHGDLGVFVLDTTGVCYAWNYRRNLVWQNLYTKLDEASRPYIKMMINTVKKGPGTLTSQEYNARKTYYVMPVVKGNKTYIVGSSYYP